MLNKKPEGEGAKRSSACRLLVPRLAYSSAFMMGTLRYFNTLANVCQNIKVSSQKLVLFLHTTLGMPNATKPSFYCLHFLHLRVSTIYRYYILPLLHCTVLAGYIYSIWQFLIFTVPKICFFSLQLMQSTVRVYSFYYLTGPKIYVFCRLQRLLSTVTIVYSFLSLEFFEFTVPTVYNSHSLMFLHLTLPTA
jgi:hypothetical protein